MRIAYTVTVPPVTNHDEAIVLPDEDPGRAVVESIWQALGLDVVITIGGISQPAAFWEDPDHWAEDWAEILGVSHDEAPGAVAQLLAEAVQ